MEVMSEPTGPNQKGRGIHGQYVYWITMSHPGPDTRGLKLPSELDRNSFRELVVKVHGDCIVGEGKGVEAGNCGNYRLNGVWHGVSPSNYDSSLACSCVNNVLVHCNDVPASATHL